MTKVLRISVLFCVLASVAGGRLPGQSTSARISGSVQNEEGKFLAGVEVTAVNVANNTQTKVYTSGAKGTFNFLSLAAGSYQVSFDLQGYRSYVAAGIRLSADQSTTLRITLERLPGAEGAAPAGEPESDQPADLGPLKTWQVEFSTGVLFINPDDLNRNVITDLKVAGDLPIEYYTQYRDSGLSIPSYFGRPKGKLRQINSLLPLTARLRFSLNRLFSLAAGIAWAERRLASAYSYAFDFFNNKPESNQLPPGHFTVISEFPDYHLEVETLFPHVGAQVVLDGSRRFRLAGFAHVGWMFAECRYSFQKSVQDGLLERISTSEMAMEGRGSGLAVEGGVKLEVALWRGLGVFVEGSYLLSRVSRVTGESIGSITVQDQKTLEVLSSVTENRRGRWWNGSEYYSPPEVWPDDKPATGAPFTLDAGGAGVRAGLFFRF